MGLDLKKGSRPYILAIVTFVIMAIFVVRLFYLQIIQHEYYLAEASKEQMKQLVIPASRGEIYAMDGNTPVKIVLNETVYTLFADPKIIDKPKEAAEITRRIAGGNARANLEELLDKKESRYQILAKKLTRKQAEMIKEAKLRGIGFQRESQRVYPEGQLAAQTLGFVDAEGNGKYGVEQAMNERMLGTNGLLQSVTDVSNVPLTIGDKNVNKPAKNGDNIVLTIDRNIQSYAEKALVEGMQKSGAKQGSVMIMDPRNGKVMAMANMPTYNPSEFNKVQDVAAFNNATISAPYEPGSDIKTLTVAAGLDRGVIEPNSTYTNTDSIKVDDRTISNATKGQTGNITMQHALNYSLNTAMVTIAQRLGNNASISREARDIMYEYFHDRMGLGELTGIELAGEAKGTVVPPTAADGNAVRYSNMSFGQGLDVTMVQVCAAFSAIINGGTRYSPTVIAGTITDDGQSFMPAAAKPPIPGVISKASSDKVRAMIHEARAAFYAKNDRAGYYTGGKTGTSQTLRDGKYVDDETVGTYLGFGGNSTTMPQYVIMVQVSGEKMMLAGAKDAMPIFTDISNWMLEYLKLQPRG